MKSQIILLLALGLSSAVAKSVLKHDGDKELLLSESNDSGTNHKEEPSNNNNTEQKNVNNEITESLLNEIQKYDASIDIVIEGDHKVPNIQDPFDLRESLLFDIGENNDISLDEDLVPMQESDYFFNDIINKDPNEIMDTASGFVPIPIFRKHQKQRKRNPIQATRRYYRRPHRTSLYNPHRRFYFYPYYRLYRSSSLPYYY